MALVAFGLGSQHNHSQVPLSPAQAATNKDHFLAPIRWPQAGHRQQLILVCTEVPPKKSQNEHTRWLASDNNRVLPD